MGVQFARMIALAIGFWCSAAAGIQQVKSLYTAVDLSACATLAATGSRTARLCGGLPGYPIYVAESERGTYLSVGPDAEKRQAARQTLSAFNRLFDKDGQRPTVEWRFVVRDQRTVPYATIVRYLTRNAAGAGQVLVVTRVSEREVCHIAYIDALANVDAIELARKIADKQARSSPCPSEPLVLGARGRSPM